MAGLEAEVFVETDSVGVGRRDGERETAITVLVEGRERSFHQAAA